MKALRMAIIGILSLTIAWWAGQRLTTWNNSIINTMDVDGYGNLYLLETEANYGRYFLCKVDPRGKLLYRYEMSELDEDYGGREYTDLRVNYAGQIFLQSYYYSYDGVEQEDIKQYSTEGVYESSLLSIDWRDQPNLPEKPYFRNMTLVDDKINLLCVSGGYFELYQLQQQGLQEPLFAGRFEVPMEVQPAKWVVTSNLQLVLTTHTGEIYHLSSEGGLIDITSLVGNRVAPATPMPDEYGNVYIADMLGMSLTHINLAAYEAKVIQAPNTRLDEAGHELLDLRDIRYLRNNTFIGQFVAPQGPQFLQFGGEEGNIWEHFHRGLALRAAITAALALMLFLLLLSLLQGILFLIKRWGIAQKLVFSLLPPYIIVMCLISLWLSSYINDSYEKERYNSLQTGMRLAVMDINGDEFGALDHLKEYGSDAYNEQMEQFLASINTLKWVMGDMGGGVLCYAYDRERLHVVYDDLHDNYTPIESTVDAEIYNKYYQLIYDTYQSRQGKIVTYTLTDQEGEWLVALHPLLDSQNLPVGVLELYMDKWYYVDLVRDQTLRIILGVMLGSVAFVCLYFFISVKIMLRPLKQLRWAVAQISEGRFDARVNIKSRDEFREIGFAFNMMSDRLKHYIDNLVLLNSAYVKFVPSRLFDLVGRDKVTEVKLNDRASLELSILYVSFFSISSASQAMTQEEYFELINQNYDQVSSAVEGNLGVITRFDGAGMMALFPSGVEKSLVCAIQLKEILGEYGHRDMRIVLSSGQALVGVAGNEKHQTIATISDEVSEIYLMNNTAERLGIKYLVTANALEKLEHKQEYQYRYIGRYQNLSRNKYTDIYEFLDGEAIYSQSLKIQTRHTFEEGVELFIRGDFFEARKRFVDVLRVNSADALASSYLLLCDNFEVNRPEVWYGCLFII